MTALFETAAEVARHKTAIGRATLSRPVKLALMDGILTQETKLFDYGCGRGDDLRILATMGFEAAAGIPYTGRRRWPSRHPWSISATSSMS